jgi:hypothetical protein
MGFLRQLSERLLRVLAQHDNNAITLGTPCLLRGATDVAAFFGYFFGLSQKSTSPVVREPQCLKKSVVNIKKIAVSAKPLPTSSFSNTFT